MTTIVGSLVVVILLLAGGEVFRRTATFEDALSADQEHLTTQNPADTLAQEDDARAAPLVASLPVVGPPIRADLRRQRALAAYWRGDYAAVNSADRPDQRNGTSEPEGEPADGATRLIEANAMFRDLARQPGNSQVLVRGLDAVLKAYVSVLEVDPNAVDAAYNYEFVSRLRGAVAAGRAGGIKTPAESSMNGDKGSPPPQTKPNEFNIIVPLSPEERLEQLDPGAGGVPRRKG
jgi:hypothetical protein